MWILYVSCCFICKRSGEDVDQPPTLSSGGVLVVWDFEMVRDAMGDAGHSESAILQLEIQKEEESFLWKRMTVHLKK